METLGKKKINTCASQDNQTPGSTSICICICFASLTVGCDEVQIHFKKNQRTKKNTYL